MRRFLLILIFLVGFTGIFSGCGEERDFDTISTRLSLDRSLEGPVFKESRRFVFDRDLSTAKGLVLKEGHVMAENPDYSMGFLLRIRIYAIQPASGGVEKVLLMESPEVLTARNSRELEVRYSGDIAEFIFDNGVELEWELQVQAWEWDKYRKDDLEKVASYYFLFRFKE